MRDVTAIIASLLIAAAIWFDTGNPADGLFVGALALFGWLVIYGAEK